MYGVGQLTLGTVLTEARCRVTFIHERHNPLVWRPLARAQPGSAAPAESRRWKRTATTWAWPWTATPTASRSSTNWADISRSTTSCCCSIGICTRCAASAAAWCATSPPRICSTVWRTHLGEQCYEVSGRLQAHCLRDAAAQRAARRRIVRRAHHSRTHSGQRRHLRVGAGGRDAGPHRPEDLRIAGARLCASPAACTDLEESLPATPEMRIAVPKRMQEAPSSHIGPYKVRQHLAHATAPSCSWKTTTGRCCASPGPSRCCACRPGRHAGEGERVVAVAAAVRDRGERQVTQQPERRRQDVAIRLF